MVKKKQEANKVSEPTGTDLIIDEGSGPKSDPPDLSNVKPSEDRPQDPPAEDSTEPKPNLIFVSKDKMPMTHINNVLQRIKLPKAEQQLTIDEDGERKATPFYHKDAGTIVRLFPTYYKHYKSKGE